MAPSVLGCCPDTRQIPSTEAAINRYHSAICGAAARLNGDRASHGSGPMRMWPHPIRYIRSICPMLTGGGAADV